MINKPDDIGFVTRTQKERSLIPESCLLISHIHALKSSSSHPQDTKLSKNTFKVTQKWWLSTLFYHFLPSAFSMLIYSYLYIKYLSSFFLFFPYIHTQAVTFSIWNLRKVSEDKRLSELSSDLQMYDEIRVTTLFCSCSLSNTNALK